ncbi:hypothetical protein GGR51DRAFT_527640 [Nemania sp. FL0031]|nr:hypothetical protein GGR51DRAFT_527640 [Nemania sp. FL0031]
MDRSLEQAITYNGEGICLQVNVDKQKWSGLKPITGFFSSRSARTHLSPLLVQSPRTGVITEDMGTLKDVQLSLSNPAFDLGLGCFGHPSKVVDAGRGELTCGPLWWTDYYQIKIARELFEGKRIWGDDEWIDFQSGGCCEDEDGEGEEGSQIE